MTVGLNWWWTPHMRLMFNYEMLKFDEEVIPDATEPTETIDEDTCFYVRYQVDF